MQIIHRWVWLPLLVAAGPAYAHAPVPGIKGFYVGLLHPFSTPAQALMLLGLGFLAGGFQVERTAKLIVAFFAFSLIGIFAGGADVEIDLWMFSAALLACSLAALTPNRVFPVAIILIAVGGFLIGSASITDAGPTRDRLFTMTGSIVGANAGLLFVAGCIFELKDRYSYDWIRIGLRVSAAWLGAIALLMLALGFAVPDTI